MVGDGETAPVIRPSPGAAAAASSDDMGAAGPRAAVGWRLWVEAVLVAAAVFWMSCWVEAPAHHAVSFGDTYRKMADHPFAFAEMFPHRPLLPMLANLLGLVGDQFWKAAEGTAVLLLVVVHVAARRWGAAFLDAVLVTAAAGLGGATQLYKSQVGYPDSLTFTFLLGSVVAIRSAGLCWSLQFVSLFAHEQAMFFWPLLLLLRRRCAGASLLRDVPWLLGTAVLYGAFRVWLAGRAPAGITPGFYFGNGYFPLGFLGVLYLSMIQAVLVFGPTLPLLGWGWERRRADWERTAMLLLLAGIVGIYLLAHDFDRFVNFLFLPLLVAQVRFLRDMRSRAILLGMLAAQAFVTRYVLLDVAKALAEPVIACGAAVGDPARLYLLITCALPRIWPAVLLFAVLLVLLVGAGAVAARARTSDGRRSEPPDNAGK
jgi:hypothetical protein